MYASWVPSGEIATSLRFKPVNCHSPNVTRNRVTTGGDAVGCSRHMIAPAIAVATSAPTATSIAPRHGVFCVDATDDAAGICDAVESSRRNRTAEISGMRRLRSFSRHLLIVATA